MLALIQVLVPPLSVVWLILLHRDAATVYVPERPVVGRHLGGQLEVRTAHRRLGVDHRRVVRIL
jgi:hypothetical protein